jgi:hypothetical protein
MYTTTVKSRRHGGHDMYFRLEARSMCIILVERSFEKRLLGERKAVGGMVVRWMLFRWQEDGIGSGSCPI